MSAEDDFAAVATRLCTACGMCCDGTMFQVVNLQQGDHPAELGKLGLRVRSRAIGFFMEQPCPALKEKKCTIYERRPTRCRLFHCQQLRLLETGQIRESDATAMIDSARSLAEEVRALILQNGLREDGQALADRYERVMSTPVDAELEPDLASAREQLKEAMSRLRLLLNRHFRPPPLAR
ncbi:MAG: YkgJ family cysteine cluster protein [Prosthecobacter sp.]